MKENWKKINDYPNYEISNLGNVKNAKGKILKHRINKGGYLDINLYKDGKSKSYLIHRLVAEAFIDNPNNLPQVNHKDENRQNNSVENLEWCDSKYNNNYGNRNLKVSKSKLGDKNPMYGKKWTEKQRELLISQRLNHKPYNNKWVIQLTLDGEYIAEFESALKAAESLGKYNLRSNITKACKTGCSSSGYKWQYKQ